MQHPYFDDLYTAQATALHEQYYAGNYLHTDEGALCKCRRCGTYLTNSKECPVCDTKILIDQPIEGGVLVSGENLTQTI